MAIYELEGVSPQIAESAWVADSAEVMGDVVLGDEVGIWFGVVVRGDTAVIRVGAQTNIQDLSVLHADVGMPLTIGSGVTVGHKAMLHGCTIGDDSLIGIGSLVTEGKEFPDGSMIMGTPAKVVRQLTPEQLQGLRDSARHYVANAQRFKASLHKVF